MIDYIEHLSHVARSVYSHFYQPEENLQFYSLAALDEQGRAVAPEFKIHVPWLAGRECEISLRSLIETDAGDVAGVSLYVQGGVKLTGSTGAGFIDNETAVREGDTVCIEDDVRLTTNNCSPETSLFDVQSLVAQSETSGLATFNLGENVASASTNGEVRELLNSTLVADAIVSFDGIMDGVPASCGEVIIPGDSVNNCGADAGDLSAVFAVSTDGTEMWSLIEGGSIEGPVNEQGNISLMESGYYIVGRIAKEPSPEDGASVVADVETLMHISIETYDTADGQRDVYARFEYPGNGDFFDGQDTDRQLRAAVPGYIRLRSVQGHEIDIDTRALVDDQLKLAFFVFKPMQLVGSHDLNGDGIADVNVSADNGLWHFRFDPAVDQVRDPGLPEGQQIPLDAAGFRVATYGADRGYAELLVRIGDTEFLVVSEFNSDSFGSLQVIDQFPVDENSFQPLFDGRDFEQFFPVELSVASPFSRDFVEEDQATDDSTADEFFDGEFTEGDFTEDDFIDDKFTDGNFADGSESQDSFTGGDTGFAADSQTSMFSDAAFAPTAITGFRADAERIAGLLSGRFRTAHFFRADHLRGTSGNASCFGPQLYYQNHPDGIDGEPMVDFASGEAGLYPALPTGDLGIWMEYDAATGNACAAAQMDAQLDAARRRTFAGLVTLAGMVRRLTPEQQANVLAGSAVSVADRMNALSIPDVVFEQATISLDAATGDWFYLVTLYETTFDTTEKTSIEMTFNPGTLADRWDYSGVIRFRAEDNIEMPNCGDSAVEHLSSLAFERVDKQSLKTEYRYGMFCGHDGNNGFDSDGMVDPTYSAVDADDGWASNFSVFVANLDPSNGAGSYAYSWQAGALDSHSRVLNVGLNDFEEPDGEAWYGYGQSLIDGIDTAGEINGFICNWAGPGNDHTLIEKAQRQWLAFDSASNLFVVPEGGSNITYAPTTSCEYNSDEGGSFLYDRNLDGALGDETSDSVDVGADELLPFDLAPPESSTYSGLDIEEVISLRGFVKPVRPESGL